MILLIKIKKLGPKRKKCIFLRYFEHLKEYVFTSEQGGNINEFESQHVIFIKNNLFDKEKYVKTYLFTKLKARRFHYTNRNKHTSKWDKFRGR